jgi:hypothetical protein
MTYSEKNSCRKQVELMKGKLYGEFLNNLCGWLQRCVQEYFSHVIYQGILFSLVPVVVLLLLVQFCVQCLLLEIVALPPSPNKRA